MSTQNQILTIWNLERNKGSQFKAPLTDVSVRTALEIAFKFWEAILHRSRPGLLKYKLLSNSTHKSFFQIIGYLLLNFVLIAVSPDKLFRKESLPSFAFIKLFHS